MCFGKSFPLEQAAQEEPYCKEWQYFDEVILKYDKKLGYQLFYSLDVVIGISKLWLLEEPFPHAFKPCYSGGATIPPNL